jgi:hypothetical protein
MNQPSIPTDAEIRLLTEMLANHDSFNDEGDPATNAQNNSMECPAPAVLWALFEPATEETAWTLRMRNHVKRCPECGPLTQRLQGFVAASDERSSLDEEYEAAWNSAKKRMERDFHNMLAMKVKPRPEPFWKLRWLPSRPMAYALGGCAAALLVLSGITLFYAGDKSDQGSSQLAQSESEIWTQPATKAGETSAPGAELPTENNPPPHSTAPSNEPPPESTSTAAGGEQQPSTGSTTAANPAKSSGPDLSGIGNGAVATSSEASKPAIHTTSVLLTPGMDAQIQILLIRHEAGGTMVEGALTAASSPGAPSVIFSARIEDGSAPVRLRIHMLELDGKRMNLQGGDVSAVTITWPETARQPVPGQNLEVRVTKGAKLTSEAEKK